MKIYIFSLTWLNQSWNHGTCVTMSLFHTHFNNDTRLRWNTEWTPCFDYLPFHLILLCSVAELAFWSPFLSRHFGLHHFWRFVNLKLRSFGFAVIIIIFSIFTLWIRKRIWDALAWLGRQRSDLAAFIGKRLVTWGRCSRRHLSNSRLFWFCMCCDGLICCIACICLQLSA